ncbi:MAG: 30S ribosomal protein S20 [Clostridiales Family XIII bacterium]|jgi:small subunit ribosomal protein S20|nr:30S ribosomal protein S20 [Clostridiales Family XIII bacterium]
MANIKSAKKRIHIIARKTARNRRVKSQLKTVLKGFEAALATGDRDGAKEKSVLAEKKLMQAAAKGTIHKNAASRKTSRIAKRLNKAGQAAE